MTMKRSIVCLCLLAGCVDDPGGNLPDGKTPDAGAPVWDAGHADADPDAGPVEPSCPTTTSGPTLHKAGDIADGEVWTAAASPHVVQGNINVRNGAKLTIEPCARVELAKAAHIHVAYPGTPNVGGTLLAEGTEKRPIRFTGKDGEAWGSVYLNAPGKARFSWVTFENGGNNDFENNTTLDVLGDQVLPADPLLFVDHVTITQSKGYGVWMQRGATFAPGSRELTITASGNDTSPFPMQLEEHAIDALPTGRYTGNKIDEILLVTYGYGIAGGGLTVDATLHERGVPYRMGASKVDNFVIGPSDAKPAATLTIEPGVVMKFFKETGLRVQTFTSDQPSRGAIRALGTADKPIVFTSAEAAPKAGDWKGLWFGGKPLAQNALDHVRIEYAGFDCGCVLNTCSNIGEHEGAVIFTAQPASAFITNSAFKDVAGHGVTEGFDGTLVNFRPTNTFENVAGCPQTLPRVTAGSCPDPKPTCDGT